MTILLESSQYLIFEFVILLLDQNSRPLSIFSAKKKENVIAKIMKAKRQFVILFEQNNFVNLLHAYDKYGKIKISVYHVYDITKKPLVLCSNVHFFALFKYTFSVFIYQTFIFISSRASKSSWPVRSSWASMAEHPDHTGPAAFDKYSSWPSSIW